MGDRSAASKTGCLPWLIVRRGSVLTVGVRGCWRTCVPRCTPTGLSHVIGLCRRREHAASAGPSLGPFQQAVINGTKP